MHATLFGTDGIRRTMGASPLTPQELVQLGNALGHWITKEYQAERVVIAHDTRLSSPLIKAALKTGLLQHPVTVTDAHVLATPLVFYNVMQGPFDVGIMITASHNPHQDNGIKLFTKRTGKSTPAMEEAITRLFYSIGQTPSYQELGTETFDRSLAATHAQALKKIFPENFLAGLRIVLDCAHGAFSYDAPALLTSFGAEVIPLSNRPNGKNINADCGSEHPEVLQKAVLEHHAQIGFAFDGDGDRILVVDAQGVEHDGDHLLALLLEHPAYAHQTTLVGTVMTNQGLEAYLNKKGKCLLRAAVGDKQVVAAMKKEECLVGGEPSGHIILRDFSDTSDGIFTCLRILETLILKKSWDVALFTHFPQIVINMPVKIKKDLTCSPYAQVIEKHRCQLEAGRLVVRYSGTEQLLRVMVEDTDKQKAETVGLLLSQELAENLAKEQI